MPPPIVFDRDSHITYTQLKLNQLKSICMRIGLVRIRKKRILELVKQSFSKDILVFPCYFDQRMAGILSWEILDYSLILL